MSSAAAVVPSSVPFISIPKLLHKWLTQLAADQKAADERERIVAHSDTPKLITRELVKRGMGAHTRVSKAIEKFREDQRRLGDTPELAVALQQLPAQWSMYCILLQEAAHSYFKQNSVNTPNFTALYFDQVTFLTLWGEIWQRYFRIGSGGSELQLMHDIQNELLSVPDMNKQQQDNASKPGIAAPQDVFNFSQAELETITATVKRVADKQQAEEQQIASDLISSMQRNFEFYEWLSGIFIMTAEVVKVEKNNTDGFIVENAEAEPIRAIKSQLEEFIGKLKNLPTNVLESEKTHTNMKDHASKAVITEWEKFTAALAKTEWQDAYRTYILAYTEWSKALKMIILFDAINKRAEDVELGDVVPCPKEITKRVPAEIDNEFVEKLKQNMEEAQNAFNAQEQQMQQHALARDRAQYAMIVEERLRMYTRLPAPKPAMIESLDDVAKDILNKVDVDSRQTFATGQDIGCRALIAIRAKKAEIRQALYTHQTIGNTYAREEEMKRAAKTCAELEEYMNNAMNTESSSQKRNVNNALLIQRSPQTLLTSELMRRPLMSTYVRQAKKVFEDVFQKITRMDILKDLTSQQLLPGNPNVALDPIETSLMISFAADNQASTFGEITRYAMWLMWVLHKDKLNTMQRPLTTEGFLE